MIQRSTNANRIATPASISYQFCTIRNHRVLVQRSNGQDFLTAFMNFFFNVSKIGFGYVSDSFFTLTYVYKMQQTIIP
jgi:hypothetical protein